jgi:hypothetical protein
MGMAITVWLLAKGSQSLGGDLLRRSVRTSTERL